MHQEGLNLLKFQRKFSTVKACQKHLFKLRWPKGYQPEIYINAVPVVIRFL